MNALSGSQTDHAFAESDGHRRTRDDTKARRIEYRSTGGHERKRRDTVGHDVRPVRDCEASGDSKLDVLVRIQYAAALNRWVSLGVVLYSDPPC